MPKIVSYNEIKDRVESKGFKLLSKEFQGYKTKMMFECSKGHKFKSTFNNFVLLNGCPICFKENKKNKLFNNVKNYIESVSGYKLLSKEYKNQNQKLFIRCPKGHVFQMSYRCFRMGHRCLHCNDMTKERLDINVIKKELNSLGYILLSKKYKNIYSKLKIKCPIGHIFEMSWNSFTNGSRCPHCSCSRGENLIRNILKNILPENINFDTQYPAFINGHNRRFDFIVYTPHKFKNVLIEYDGEQHFKKVGLWDKSGYTLKDRIKADTDKTNWAINNNFRLVRFKFTESDDFVYNKLEYILENDFDISVKHVNIDYEMAETNNY